MFKGVKLPQWLLSHPHCVMRSTVAPMTGTDPRTEDAAHWQSYWRQQQAGGAGAVTSLDQNRVFAADWDAFFLKESADRAGHRIIDLGCGAGLVLARAKAVPAFNENALLVGLDYAEAAARQTSNLAGPGSATTGVAAAITAAPFKDQVFDIIVSQFGLEYAGMSAFEEAGRLLAPQGVMRAIIHYKDGAIHQECRNNAEMVGAIRRSGLIDDTKRFFSAVQAHQQDAAQIMNTANVLRGNQTADVPARPVVQYVVDAVLRFVNRPQAFARQEVLHWLDGVAAELDVYAARMNAMVGAAMDEKMLQSVSGSLSAKNIAVHQLGPMYLGGVTAPAAWKFEARRRGD